MRAAPVVRVAARAAGQAAATAAGADGMHRAEAGRGQRGEHARMLGHRFGDALAAGQPGPDDLPGVALVHLRAGRADVLAAVAARDPQHTARLAGGVIDRGDLAGRPVDGVDAAVQAHRVGAVASPGELLLPAGEIVTGSKVEQLIGRGPRFRAIAGEPDSEGGDRHETTAAEDAVAAQRVQVGSSPSAGMPRSPFMRTGLVRVTAAMKGAQGNSGHQTGPLRRLRGRSACFRSRRPCPTG